MSKASKRPELPAKRSSHRTPFLWAFGFLLMFAPIALHASLGLAISPILTGSMRPVANPGDLILTKQVQAKDLKVGQIAVLRNPTDYSLYAHRITSVTSSGGNETIQTKGDNNPAPDAFKVTVSKLETVPIRFATVRWAGWAIVGFTSHLGQVLALLAVGLAILLGGSYLFTRERELREHRALILGIDSKKGKKSKSSKKIKGSKEGKSGKKGKSSESTSTKGKSSKRARTPKLSTKQAPRVKVVSSK